jgi:arginase
MTLTWCEVPHSPTGRWYSQNPGDLKVPMAQNSDLCIVGVPYDAGQTATSGQSSAPGVIRLLENFESWWTSDLGDLSTVKVVDAGDLPIDHRNAEADLTDGKWRTADLIPNTSCLLALGGDHSITAAMLAARKDKPIVIHLDAHTDCYPEEFPQRTWPTHASWVPWVLEEQLARSVWQFGVRAVGAQREPNVRTFPGMLSPKALELRLKEFARTFGADVPVYLSIDMDVVDPAYCPGVAYPEPGGWNSYSLLKTVEEITAKLNVVGVDIVEVTPALDVRDMSVRLAHRSVLAVIRGIKRKQS